MIKRAILNALAIDALSEQDHALIEIDETRKTGVSIKARGRVRQTMWDQGIVEFSVCVEETADLPRSCTVIGISDAS